MARKVEMNLPPVIAAIHLLPSVASMRRDAYTASQIVDHALVHAKMAYRAGVRAWYIQDTRDTPLGPTIIRATIELFSKTANALRTAYPDVALGIAMMQHGGRIPLEIAHSVDADFVRLKVYVGVMVKMEGLLSGCAHEAISTRRRLRAERVKIFADIYDRVGEPLAPLPLKEACRQAVEFGRADGLILTGRNASHSQAMLDEVGKLPVPKIVGGGVTEANVGTLLKKAEHVIVHGAFSAPKAGLRNGLPVEWNEESIKRFIAVSQATGR